MTVALRQVRPVRIVAAWLAVLGVASGARPNTAFAQQSAAGDSIIATSLPSRCVAATTQLTPPPPPPDSARRAAHEIAGRAQAASIVGDNTTAAELYRQAAVLDPTEPDIAYALGREYEAAHDPRAMTEYCRFLVLNPRAVEVPDVRQRIAALSLALPPDTTIVRIPVTAPAHLPSSGAALGAGLLIPGLGQFTTHRPAAGFLVMAATGAAVLYGLKTEKTTAQVTNTGIDPFGNSYQYQTTVVRTGHPHAAAGIGTAAAIMVGAAIEAFTHARGARSLATAPTASPSSHAVVPAFNLARRSLGLVVVLR